MEQQSKSYCQKKSYQKVGFELKLLIIDQIHNGSLESLPNSKHALGIVNVFSKLKK